MKLRVKPEYASRSIIGVSNLKLYYINGKQFELEQDNISIDDDGFYNFTIEHNSEFALANGAFDTLEKNSSSKSSNPATGDMVTNYIFLFFISIIGLLTSLVINKITKKQNK